jgi:hypothetical protein
LPPLLTFYCPASLVFDLRIGDPLCDHNYWTLDEGRQPKRAVELSASAPDRSYPREYAWDARPYPAFPFDTDLWIDGDNWRFGHWLNGRLTGVPLDSAVGTLLEDFDFTDYDTSGINGMVQGFLIDRVMSAREAMQPLELAYFYDALESGSKIVFRHRGGEPPVKSFGRTRRCSP